MKKSILLSLLLFLLPINSNESMIGVIRRHVSFDGYDSNIVTKLVVIRRLINIESKYDSTAHNVKEDALGVLQIRRCVVDDINQHLGYKKYSYNDRKSIQKSVDIFIDYQKIYNNDFDVQRAVRMWNGGPNGHRKQQTLWYYNEFLRQ